MALQIIPVVPSIGSYRLSCSLAYAGTNNQHIFELLWNSRDAAWYVNVLQADDSPIIVGSKIVLGAFIGNWSQHPMFLKGALYAYDISGMEREATLNDLGTRVLLTYMPQEDLVLIASPNQ